MWWRSWIFLRHSVLETNWTITWCSDYTQRWFSACSLSLQPLPFSSDKFAQFDLPIICKSCWTHCTCTTSFFTKVPGRLFIV
jgi:hypothetical protein